MKIINRTRAENNNQKCYILEFNSIYGKTTLTTFLTEKEANKYKKNGIICNKKGEIKDE